MPDRAVAGPYSHLFVLFKLILIFVSSYDDTSTNETRAEVISQGWEPGPNMPSSWATFESSYGREGSIV